LVHIHRNFLHFCFFYVKFLLKKVNISIVNAEQISEFLNVPNIKKQVENSLKYPYKVSSTTMTNIYAIHPTNFGKKIIFAIKHNLCQLHKSFKSSPGKNNVQQIFKVVQQCPTNQAGHFLQW